MANKYNPVDAHRKAQRARELKKNKEARKDKRDTLLVKKDTRDIEKEIKSLKAEKKLHEGLQSRLDELEKELKHITAAKEKYVKEHPEEKDKVFKPWAGKEKRGPLPGHDDEDGNAQASGSGSGRSMEHLYDDEGRLRDPKKSVYYDATYNPFGVPPPGMPYREKSEEESEDESDDDIVMPAGPPPGADSDNDSDDSDDIPLPPGPPPPKPSTMPLYPPQSGPGYISHGQPFHARPPVPVPIPFGHYHRPPPVQSQPFRPPPGVLPAKPLIGQPPTSLTGASGAGLPPRPPTSSSTGQISAQAQPISAAPTTSKPPTAVAATISAEPVMRDLRKETTVFVPRNLKRKKGVTSVNAAPAGGGEIDADGDELRRKRDDGPGLMGRLQGVLGEAGKSAKGEKGKEGDDEYQDFLKGLGDLA